ncbi:MAG: UDP-N-acetylmuramoyl-tripeptide--D-alanyl-D-alanine ligase [Treponema sp.]|nr:UDP-N-acetylmuramoyl-tripeptide--D-alanyl-D-alanine ligase [Treponema sp.]
MAESLLSLDELISAVHGKVAGLAENIKNCVFTSVATDSRNVTKNTLFVPLIGEFQDGHKYIPGSIENGASVIFVTRSVYEADSSVYMELSSKNPEVVFIVVENNLTALQDAARAYVKKFPDLVKVSVTGSSGKTTTKEIAASILRQHYNLIATVGNFNSETGLPLSVFNIRKEHECGLFEMGMNRENEIGEIAKVFKPNYAIITNIGNAHIGLLGSRENIAKEKKKIFGYINKDGAAFIPEKDDFASFLAEGVEGKVVYYGKDVPETVSGVKFIKDLGVEGTLFSVDGLEVKLSLPGSYNYLNALGCIAMAKQLGISAAEIKAGIESLADLNGRSSIKTVTTVKNSSGQSHKIQVMEDCYNANPDAMEKVIELCTGLEVKGRKIFILGDMLELGEESAKEHSRIGALASISGADTLCFVGKEMENGATSAKMSGKLHVKYFSQSSDENIETICRELLDYVQDGDFVLLKASHGMHFERIVNKIVDKEAGQE